MQFFVIADTIVILRMVRLTALTQEVKQYYVIVEVIKLRVVVEELILVTVTDLHLQVCNVTMLKFVTVLFLHPSTAVGGLGVLAVFRVGAERRRAVVIILHPPTEEQLVRVHTPNLVTRKVAGVDFAVTACKILANNVTAVTLQDLLAKQ
jgi:hypothetical protein